MLLIFGFVLFLLLSTLVLLMPLLWAREIRHAYASPRPVTCPENHQQVAVTIDTSHAVLSRFRDRPSYRLSDCTRWPARARCGQECLSEALQSAPYTKGEVQPSKTVRQIYHLPVILAAFAAWYIGLLWHSHYLFRARWMEALGLTPAEVKQLVLWYSPHLLSVGACLLFAYGVAWLQIWLRRKGIWQGILSSTLLWSVLMLACSPSMRGIPRQLLLIEASYTLIAAIVVGVIVGSLRGKLVLPEFSPAEWRHKTDAA